MSPSSIVFYNIELSTIIDQMNRDFSGRRLSPDQRAQACNHVNDSFLGVCLKVILAYSSSIVSWHLSSFLLRT